MSPTEVAYRTLDAGRRWSWARRQVQPGEAAALPAIHRHSVAVDSLVRRLTIVDTFNATAALPLRLLSHLSPDIAVDLDGGRAALSWQVASARRQGPMVLAEDLAWTRHRADVDPILGLYSRRFGCRVLATSLVGQGMASSSTSLATELELP
jgi:hypothetical protein